jgi:imidazole glycerol-phosphate synthase subunit HisF
MLKRIIPILLMRNRELVKSVCFNNYNYIGDVINAVKIYNELEVDELLIFDITAYKLKSELDYDFLKDITSECFVPLTYGGNVDSIMKIEELIKIGIEKVCINTRSQDIKFISEAVHRFGTSTISVCVDYKYIDDEPVVFYENGKINSKKNVIKVVQQLSEIKVGEIILQNIDSDGTYCGYDLNLLVKLKPMIKNPIVMAGGCRDKLDIKDALEAGANACAAGSLFVYYTPSKGILINYLDRDDFVEIDIKR